MVPVILEPGIAIAPEDSLPSLKDFFLLVWGHQKDNMVGFPGFQDSKVCCKLVFGKSACQVQNILFKKNIIFLYSSTLMMAAWRGEGPVFCS